VSRVTPKIWHFAKRLVLYETGLNRRAETQLPPAFGTCEMLRPHLVTFMGIAGFSALLSRALSLASPAAPCLRTLHVAADGTLGGVKELQGRLNTQEWFEAKVLLLAQLLELLVAFIGEKLTVSLVRDVWPRIPARDLEFDHGGEK
jgi:hypothetical protein